MNREKLDRYNAEALWSRKSSYFIKRRSGYWDLHGRFTDYELLLRFAGLSELERGKGYKVFSKTPSQPTEQNDKAFQIAEDSNVAAKRLYEKIGLSNRHR